MSRLKSVELQIFLPSLALAIIPVVATLMAPVQTSQLVDSAFHFLTHQLGWLYLLTIMVLLGFSLWIAFSKFGSIKLGEADEPKQYSDWSWTAMIFAAGMSIAVVLLGFVEPINVLTIAPLGPDASTSDAYEYAHLYAQFFEGPIAWGVYGPASAAVAYTLYVKKNTVLRISNACAPVLKGHSTGPMGTAIDVLVMLGMIGGVSTSLGMGTPAVTAIIEHITGIPESLGMTLVVLLFWALLFGTSVYLGLDKGIRVLSDINLYIMFILLAIVFVSQPINEYFFLQLNSLGLMLDNFWSLSLGSCDFATETFTKDCTVYYWAWWLAFMPMIALFGARISRGRTIRQMILGELLYGGGGSLFVFGLLGAYSLHLHSSGTLDLVTIVQEQGREQAVIAIIQTLPFGEIVLGMVLLLIFLFLATTIDSTAYTLASVCTVKLRGDEQPERWNRMVWAGVLLLFSLALILIGGLETIQTASILMGFPLIFISVILMVSVVKMYRGHNFSSLNKP